MKRLALLLALPFVLVRSSSGQEGTPLKEVGRISLEGVEGRIDHFGADVEGRRLFMAALGNNTVEVFDLAHNKRLHTIRGLSEPQGIFYVASVRKIYVANGRDGSCRIYDGDSYSLIRSVDFGEDADNVRYDPAAHQVLVGYGSGALGILDEKDGNRLGDVKLPAHPESFRLERSGPRIFVNLPDAGIIAVVDRVKQVILSRWPNPSTSANFPMTLDEPRHRLFVAYRRPARLAVFDTESGKLVASLPAVGDADDLWYDEARKRIYVSGGEGALSVIEQRDADHYAPLARIATAPGARTSYFVPELNRLYLAVPHRGAQKAELRIFEPRD